MKGLSPCKKQREWALVTARETKAQKHQAPRPGSKDRELSGLWGHKGIMVTLGSEWTTASGLAGTEDAVDSGWKEPEEMSPGSLKGWISCHIRGKGAMEG